MASFVWFGSTSFFVVVQVQVQLAFILLHPWYMASHDKLDNFSLDKIYTFFMSCRMETKYRGNIEVKTFALESLSNFISELLLDSNRL
jgi:hypothetical protein